MTEIIINYYLIWIATLSIVSFIKKENPTK